jgi:hypothetical protein
MFLQDPTQPRSIFFIGHSLGGLVIKEVNDPSIPSDIILTNVRVDRTNIKRRTPWTRFVSTKRHLWLRLLRRSSSGLGS